MEFAPRVWKFVADMSHDGSVSIRDVWLWAKWLYFYPGDLFIQIFMYPENFGGVFSFTVSLIVWLAVFVMFLSVWRVIRKGH